MDQKDRNKIKSEFDAIELDIAEKIDQLNPEELFAAEGELPALSDCNVEQLDYTKQITKLNTDATNIVNNLAELYLGDENLLENSYIKDKRRKDAEYYGKLEFLVETSQKTLINVMREIDMGNAHPKMFEVQSMLQKEMRDNIKLSSSSLSNIESFYKSIRKDLGMSTSPSVTPAKEVTDETTHVDMKEFNQQLEDMMNNPDGSFNVDLEDEDDE